MITTGSESRSEWQSIETAPEDGEWIVAAWFDNGVRRWWYRAHFYQGLWRTRGGVVDPTHWLPLPDPPAIRRDDAPQKGKQSK
jgi:hypothetical protein